MSSSAQQASKIAIPEWMEAGAKENYDLAKDISTRPYQTYSGQRIADFTGAQNDAMKATRAAQGYGQDSINSARAALGGVSGSATPMIGSNTNAPPVVDSMMRARGGDIGAAHTPGRAQIGSLGGGGDMPPAIADLMASLNGRPMSGPGGAPTMMADRPMMSQSQALPVNQNQVGTVPSVSAATVDPSQLERVSAERFTDADINSYLNQYRQAALDPTLAEIGRQGQILQTQNAARAQGAGAFGGSRHGLVEAETNKAILDQMAKTQAEGLSRGFDTAAGLVQGDQGRALQAGLANQNVSTQGVFRNQDAENAARSQTAGFQQQTNLANQSAALQKLGLDINAASSQGQLAKLGQDMNYNDIAKLMGVGDTQQKMNQSNLDLGYNDFLKEQNYPQEQLNMLISTLNQTPYSRTTYQPGGNTAAQVGGGLASLLSMLLGK